MIATLRIAAVIVLAGWCVPASAAWCGKDGESANPCDLPGAPNICAHCGKPPPGTVFECKAGCEDFDAPIIGTQSYNGLWGGPNTPPSSSSMSTWAVGTPNSINVGGHLMTCKPGWTMVYVIGLQNGTLREIPKCAAVGDLRDPE